MVRVDLPARPETFYQTIEIVSRSLLFPLRYQYFSSGSELDRGTIAARVLELGDIEKRPSALEARLMVKL